MSESQQDGISRALAGSHLAELERRLAHLEAVVAVLVARDRLEVGGGGDGGGGEKDGKGGVAGKGEVTDAGDRGEKGFPFF